MHGDNIIMTKEERAAMLERVEVLQKVKALLLIPRLFMATTQQVADFFEVEVDAVRKCYQRNRDELDANGTVLLTLSEVDERTGQDVQSVKMRAKRLYCVDDVYFEANNCATRMFPPRAILNMAMLLPNSRVAKEVRNQLLNIAENASPQARVTEIVNEQEMQLEIGKAFASGDIMAFAQAAKKMNDFLNRHLLAAQQQVTALSQKAEHLETTNQQLAVKSTALEEANNSLNAVNAMLAQKSLVWPPRATLNALIRAIAVAAFDRKYSVAWDRFYRELKYRAGIYIESRSAAKRSERVLDGVKDKEWPKLLEVAASLCYDYCVDVVHATNEETVAEYHLDTIETEYGVRYNRGTTTRKLNEVG